MKKKVLAVLMTIVLSSAALSAAAFWEGTAVASSYGEFPQAGLYGACSSFPRNTMVEVQNLENGKTVQVLVTDGLDNPGVFISLSPEASYELGIIVGMVARVRVSMPRRTSDAALRYDVPGTNDDPDLNPAALVNRERAKRGGAVAEASPEPTPFVAVLPSPVSSPRPTPVPSARPAFTPAGERPQAIADRRRAPGDTRTVRKPGDVPEVEERVAVATPGPSPAASAAPLATPLSSPEAIVYDAGAKRDARAKAFALREPLLEKQVSEERVASVEAYERLRAKPRDAAAPRVALAEPGIADRERPEAGFDRLKSPESKGLSVAKLPDAKLEARPEDAGTTVVEEGSPEAIALERASRRESRGVKAALAVPVLKDVGHEAPEAIAFDRAVRIDGMPLVAALPAPALIEAGPARAEAIALERATGKREGQPLVAALVDPEIRGSEEAVPEGSAEAIALERASRREGAAPLGLALVDPEWADTSETPEAYERLAAKAVNGKGVEAALSEPGIDLEAEETAIAYERMNAARKQGLASTEGALPDPDAQVVSLAAAEDMPPEAIELERKRILAKAGGRSDVALADPQVPSGVEAPVDESAVIAYSGRLEPGDGKGATEFAKAAPEVREGAGEDGRQERGTGEVDTVATVVLKPSDDRPPDAVVSARKSAEAAKFELAGAKRIDALSAGTYYVQIGVFGSALGARDALDAMARKYPMTYEEYESRGKRMMKLYVGPLRKDEGGLVLYQVKSLGYKDAFLKKAD